MSGDNWRLILSGCTIGFSSHGILVCNSKFFAVCYFCSVMITVVGLLLSTGEK